MSGLHRSPRRGAPASGDGGASEQELGSDGHEGPFFTLADIVSNPGLLKLELMVHGVQLAPELLSRARGEEAFRNYFANTRDIELILSEGTHVTAPVGLSPYLLKVVDGDFVVEIDPTRLPEERREGGVPDPVKLHFQEPGEFYTRRSSRGVPLSSIGTIRGSYLALSPTSTCDFLGSDQQCSFCSLSEVQSPGKIEVEDVLEAVGVAKETNQVDVVYLSTGYEARPDSGVLDLEPFIRAIKHRYDILVAVDALPPSENVWIDRTYAMGVDAISYNLEIFDPTLFEQICPGPANTLGRQRFLDALDYAVGVFPSGAVICHLMVGMEELSSTAKGVEALTKAGIVPVLPLFRPFKGLDMRLHPSRAAEARARLRPEALAGLYGLLYRKVRQHRIPLNWARHVSVASTPLEGRFFTGEEARLLVFLDKLAQTRLGRVTRARLADLRRLLRVRSN